MWPLLRINPVEKFWRWFKKNEANLYNFESDQERVFDRLAAELQKVNSDLTFEFGPKHSKREFVISAGGIKSAFPSVVSLANAAPPLERWRVTAFRPRRNPLNKIEFRDKHVDPAGVEFSLLDNGTIAGIYLFITGFHEGDSDYGQIGYLMLDEALGEFDVETNLGLIKMFSFDMSSDFERHPLSDLPVLFDQLTSRLQARSGLPS